MLVRLDKNGMVLEIMRTDKLHPGVLSQCVEAPKKVTEGWFRVGDHWLPPSPGPGYQIIDGSWHEPETIKKQKIKERKRSDAIERLKELDLQTVKTIADLKNVVSEILAIIGAEK